MINLINQRPILIIKCLLILFIYQFLICCKHQLQLLIVFDQKKKKKSANIPGTKIQNDQEQQQQQWQLPRSILTKEKKF